MPNTTGKDGPLQRTNYQRDKRLKDLEKKRKKEEKKLKKLEKKGLSPDGTTEQPQEGGESATPPAQE